MKVGEGWVCWDMMSSMCQHVATLQFGSCAEKDSLFGTVMMVWINASHKLFPRLTQKKCCTVYLLNLIHEFASFFSTKGDLCSFAQENLPVETGLCRTSVFLCGCASHATDSPKASRKAKSIFPMKESWGTAAYAEIWWVQCANMWQHCNLAAVQRKTAFLEQSWWFWIKASHTLLPRLTQKKCCTVYLLNLIHEFTSFFSTKVIYAALPKKTFPWKQAFVDISVSLWLRKPRQRFRPRPAERLNQFSRWKKVGEGCVCWDMMSSMCQHVTTLQFECNLAAVQRKTAFLEQSWWFGSTPRTSSSQGWRKRSVVQSTF